MPRLAPLFAFLLLGRALAAAPSPAEASIARAQSLISAHRAATTRLLPAATATAERLLAGAHWYLAGTPTWIAEGCNRAAGPQWVAPLLTPAGVQPGDVVWLAYASGDYAAQMNLGADLARRGARVIAFGPRAPSAPHAAWVDSLTGRDSAANFVLLGNLLSLWSATAEVAAATARAGRTLVFLQSHVIRDAAKREALYQGLAFHRGFPAMAPVPAGRLAPGYLDYVAARVAEVRGRELAHLAQVGREVAQRSARGRPAVFSVEGGHIMPDVVRAGAGLYRYEDRERAVVQGTSLRPGDRLVFFGYVSVPLDLWATVHRAGATAVWIEAPLPTDADFAREGDLLIDQGWRIGDAALEVPGYDMRILPPSGAIELVLYESLMAEARIGRTPAR